MEFRLDNGTESSSGRSGRTTSSAWPSRSGGCRTRPSASASWPQAAAQRHRAALPHRDRLRRPLGRGRRPQATTPRRSSASRAGSATSSDPQAAEAAIVIGDAFQGQGLGRRLGLSIADAARLRDVRRFTGDDAVEQRRRAAAVRRDLRAARRGARRRDGRRGRDARRVGRLAAVAGRYTLRSPARGSPARSTSTTSRAAVDALEVEARAFANTERREAAAGIMRTTSRRDRRAARRGLRPGRPRRDRRARRRRRGGVHRPLPRRLSSPSGARALRRAAPRARRLAAAAGV